MFLILIDVTIVQSIFVKLSLTNNVIDIVIVYIDTLAE